MTNPLFDFLVGDVGDNNAPLIETLKGEKYTYGEFEILSGKIASIFRNRGVKKGDRVASMVEKSPEALAIYLAVIRIGGVFLPLNPDYTKDEVGYFVEDAKPSLVVVSPEKVSFFGKKNIIIETLGNKGEGSLVEKASLESGDFDNCKLLEGDLAAILYTSGTTGRSKGVMLTHGNLISNAKSLINLWGITKQDKLLHALPIYHTHGLFVGTNVIMGAKASLMFLGKFNVGDILKALPTTNMLMGVPTFYTRLLNETKFTRNLVTHYRIFISGSAPLLSETHKKFEEKTGHVILERYGMTETNMNTSNPLDGPRKAGTVGLPLPGVSLRIRGAEENNILRENEIGNIEVKGPNVFKGYWNRQELNEEEFTKDGFFKTGDLGKIDDDGYVHIVGRSKDLIISGGFNIYPKEIESKIDDIEGVIESAVIGCPHKDLGEGLVAIIVSDTPKLNETKVMTELKAKLARYKQPKKIYFLESLPRNIMGKVQKNKLRDRYSGAFK